MPSRPFSGHIILFVKGFFMGAADIIPGVSGGTMALILGIYEELIQSIRSFDLKFLKLVSGFRVKEALASVSWPFLLAVFVGILCAVFSMARFLSWVLGNHPVMVWSFFFGLILSSVFTVSRVIIRWRTGTVISIILGSIGAYHFFGIIPAATPDTLWFIFISGALAICAMVLPGISGAYILVILGKYPYVLDAVNNCDFITLFALASGALVGLLSFVRIVGWLFKRYHDLTMAILIGLMLGSLRKVWPWKKSLIAHLSSTGKEAILMQHNILPSSLNSEVCLAVLMMFAGFLSVLLIDYQSKKFSHL